MQPLIIVLKGKVVLIISVFSLYKPTCNFKLIESIKVRQHA